MLYFLFVLVATVLTSCETVIPEAPPAEVKTEGEKIFIVDQQGKQWDITHAVNHYGLKPDEFQFGLGENAIRPIINPTMLCAGERGYPSPGDTRIVIGAEFNGEARAYSIDDLNPREIVDEVFGDQYVAVAW